MSVFLSLLLFVQFLVRNDLVELRQYLGMTYPALVQALTAKNQILLRNTERLAPQQAAEMRQRMLVPDILPPDHPVVNTRLNNVGQGLVTFLFEDDFLTEQVNFVFCPSDVAAPSNSEHVMTIQVLFDDRRAAASTLKILQSVYQMPAPLPPGSNYMTVLMYPLAANLPVTTWNAGNFEAVYQPIPDQRLITAQLWLTDKNVVMQCTKVPQL
jgi:hypothetical protein